MTLTDEWRELDEALAGDEPDYDVEPEAPGGELEADQFVRRLNRLRRERAAMVEAAQAEKDRIDARLAGLLETADRSIGWHERSLASYHAALLAVDPKRKTLHLVNGDLKARGQQDQWEVDDDEFLAWAREHAPELINPGEPAPPTPKPDKNALKAAARPVRKGKPGDRVRVVATVIGEDGKPTDVEVPGVAVVVRGNKFEVVPNEGESE